MERELPIGQEICDKREIVSMETTIISQSIDSQMEVSTMLLVGAAAGLLSAWRTRQISPNHRGTTRRYTMSGADQNAKLQCRQC